MSHNEQTVLLRNLLKRKTVHQGGLAIHRKARKELKNIRNIDAFSAVQSASAVKPTGVRRLVERLSPYQRRVGTAVSATYRLQLSNEISSSEFH